MIDQAKLILFLIIFICISMVRSQSLEPFELTSDWIASIEAKVKKHTPTVAKKQKKVLIFSLHTGYKHWTIPHTEAVMNIIAQNSGVFDVTLSKDIAFFNKKKLSEFDVVVLNNNCSKGERRDLFWDVLNEDNSMSPKEKLKKANQLERNLIRFVEKGKGLVILHGGIVMQNNSLEFSNMSGGSFNYHPPQQEIHVKLVDPNHPLVTDFDSEGFVHYDEPYFFKNAYFKYDFKPLLYFELDDIEMRRERPSDKIKYISWIKRHGKGRVFYSSPSHNAQSYNDPNFLQFLRKGLLYAGGLLTCDDSPAENIKFLNNQ
jgi:type 1 glutamine amidotransferase